ncbi:hypothetical protein [Nocardioides sp.]|uniref:hypothetical protein n=1 Tax=Nocardioides sp. TaxID=35761 RepID=UPI0035AFB496
MSTDELLHAEFEAAASAVAAARPEVDLATARELMREAATMLDNSLALDSLSDADAAVVVRHLAADLTAVDPSAAVLARSLAVAEDPSGLDEPDVVAETYLVCAAVLGL